MSGVQVRTQDHLRSKVRKKLEPLIEDQKLLNRQLVMEMAEKGYVKLIEKIGAKKVIQDLRDAEETHTNAVRKATAFFKKTARTSRAYNNSLSYDFTSRDKDTKITADKCESQCRTWSENYAEREVQKTEQGKELKRLLSLEEACDDIIMEATSSNDLTSQLNDILKVGAGIEWHNFKALGYQPKAKGK
jgi:hypothetical protein|tara:strand:- start:731 stop:1297 length:567 start_codon:yes stop_codon:yes gene_type:complete